jgi:alkylhydroperoxidase family enzyme
MLGFVAKLNTDPSSVGPSDAEAVLKAGVSEQAFRDALYVVAMFELINRLADSFGFAVPDPSSFEDTASKLLRFGYRL